MGSLSSKICLKASIIKGNKLLFYFKNKINLYYIIIKKINLFSILYYLNKFLDKNIFFINKNQLPIKINLI
jgi:hypothetical protein